MESTAGKNWTEEDEKLLLETIDKWVENEVKPIAREYDQEDKYPHELVESMKDLGLFGATISPEYGGMGLPASIYAKVIIKVASVWMAPSGIFNSHLIMASAIERCGTDEQKTNWLPKWHLVNSVVALLLQNLMLVPTYRQLLQEQIVTSRDIS